MAEIAREILHVNLEDEMKQLVPRLRDERDRGARAARRPRRPEARASPRALRDARARQRLEQGLQEVGARRRRRDRQVPPARRHGGVRHHRAHGAAVLDALPARRRTGQLRLGGRRRPGRDALHRGAHVAPRLGAAGRHRQGNGRFRPELRRIRVGTDGAADPGAEPAGQRLLGYRRRHGDQHTAAQPDRGGGRLRRADRPAGDHDPRADGAGARARTSRPPASSTARARSTPPTRPVAAASWCVPRPRSRRSTTTAAKPSSSPSCRTR